jgi:hypothetical protein
VHQITNKGQLPLVEMLSDGPHSFMWRDFVDLVATPGGPEFDGYWHRRQRAGRKTNDRSSDHAHGCGLFTAVA